MKKYVADTLRFIEFERKALPCALMRYKEKGSALYTYSAAGEGPPHSLLLSSNRSIYISILNPSDMDARSVMEQRIQSLVCCVSLVQQVINHQPEKLRDIAPLNVYPPSEAVQRVWAKIIVIPSLIEKHMLERVAAAASKRGISLERKRSKHQEEVDREEEDDKKGGEGKGVPSAGECAAVDEEEEDLERQIKVGNYNKLLRAKAEIDEIVKEEPSAFSSLRQKCLAIREICSDIEALSTSNAR